MKSYAPLSLQAPEEDQAKSLDSVLESMRHGRFHWVLLLLCGLSFLSDAMVQHYYYYYYYTTTTVHSTTVTLMSYALCCMTLHDIALLLYCIALYFIALHCYCYCILLYCIALHYIMLYSSGLYRSDYELVITRY
jgi:hypothetical protein